MFFVVGAAGGFGAGTATGAGGAGRVSADFAGSRWGDFPGRAGPLRRAGSGGRFASTSVIFAPLRQSAREQFMAVGGFRTGFGHRMHWSSW